MSQSDADTTLKSYISNKLKILNPIFSKATIGDFTQNVQIPKYDDEFTPIFVGIQVMLDVIREQLAALELKNMESQKLASIVENSDEGIYSWSIDGVITSWNKGAEKIYGYRGDEVIGKPFFMFIPTERQNEGSQLIEKIRSGVSIEHFESVRIRKDGTLIHVAKTISPIRDSDGSVIGAAVMTTDITFRKQAEQYLIDSTKQIEQEKSKTDTIIVSIADALFATDQNGFISLMNTVAEQFSGVNHKDAIGKHYADIFHFRYEKDESLPYAHFVQDVIKTGTATLLSNHSVLVHKSGSKLPITFTAAPMKDTKNGVFGSVVVIRDITRERMLEKAKDEFISVAAHQLRTPLGVMRWNMELLLGKNGEMLPESLRAKINDVYQSNLRIITLVNELLNISRIEQGRAMNEPKRIDIHDVLKSLLKDILAEASRKNLSIAVNEQPGKIPHVVVDPKRLYESIQNVLSNSLKYTSYGGTITITLEPKPGEVLLSVADNGMGIPVRDQARIFTKFYRGENAALSQTDGSGLGLFIVKSYVEGWGGKVWFDSPTIVDKDTKGNPYNHGTTIYMTIPTYIK